MVGLMVNRFAINYVGIDYVYAVERAADHACLLGDRIVSEAPFNLLDRRTREKCDAVIGLLAERGDLIAERFDLFSREGVVDDLCFLQAKQVRLVAFEHAGDTYTYVRSWTSGLLSVCYLNMGEADRVRLFVEEREEYDWFDTRIPMVFIAASYAHLKGDYGAALQLALDAKARVGAEWSGKHEEWLAAFRTASTTGRPTITDYYTLQASGAR